MGDRLGRHRLHLEPHMCWPIVDNVDGNASVDPASSGLCRVRADRAEPGVDRRARQLRQLLQRHHARGRTSRWTASSCGTSACPATSGFSQLPQLSTAFAHRRRGADSGALDRGGSITTARPRDVSRSTGTGWRHSSSAPQAWMDCASCPSPIPDPRRPSRPHDARTVTAARRPSRVMRCGGWKDAGVAAATSGDHRRLT